MLVPWSGEAFILLPSYSLGTVFTEEPLEGAYAEPPGCALYATPVRSYLSTARELSKDIEAAPGQRHNIYLRGL